MMTESRDEAAVRAMLARRAADVRPDPGAWEAITERLDEPDVATVLPFRRPEVRRRLLAVATAAAVVAAAIGGLALLDRPDPTSSIVADDGEPDLAVPAPGGSQAPIWPATTADELDELQAAADAGQRDDLLDPVGVAGGYLTERLAGPGQGLDDRVALELGDFEPRSAGEDDDDAAGSVRYLLDGPDGRYVGFVDLRRLDGEGSIWVVTRSGTPSIDLVDAAYDGTDVTTSFRSVTGLVEVELAGVDGSDPIVTLQAAITSEEDLVELRERFADKPGVTVLFRLFPEVGDDIADPPPAVIAEVRLDDDDAAPEGTVASPATTTTTTTTDTTTTTPVEDGAARGETTVLVEPDGLGFVGAGDDDTISRLLFGSDQTDVVATLSAALGEPVESGTNQDCGVGPAEVISYPDGFVVTFTDGALVGWAVSGAAPRTAAGIGVGSTVAEALAAVPGSSVVESTIGWELASEDLYALLSGPDADDTVETLFGGANCIFR